jgi:hypothetical protein
MRLETFFEKFDLFADAPNAVAKLRELVLEPRSPGTACGLIPAYEERLVERSSSSIPYATLLHASRLSFSPRSYLDLYRSPQR